MKKLIFIFAAFSSLAFSQSFTSTALQNSDGNYARIVPLAPVIVCQSSDNAIPCTHTVTTYTDQTLGTPCTLNNNAVGAPTSGAGCNNPGIANLAGQFAVFLPAGTYNLCFYAQVYSCIPISTAGGTVNWSQVLSGSNLNALTMGSGGSLSPLNLGQVVGSQLWLQPGLASFSGSSSANSGSIVQNHTWQEQYTLVSALGQTLPSPIATQGSLGSCGTGCSITMTAPALPAGYTYSVYACDLSAGGACTSPVNVPGCTNITTNCVITASVLSGTAPPTIDTAIIQPPNVQATNGPPGWLPSLFAPRLDGNYYPCLGINTTDINNGVTGGILQDTCQMFFSDFTIPDAEYSQYIPYKNSGWVFAHAAGTNTNFTGNQDRAVSIINENPAGDTASRYGVEGLQEETVVNGAPTFTGSPDGSVIGIQGQVTSNTTAAVQTGGGMVTAINASVFNNSNSPNGYLSGAGQRVFAVNAQMTNNNTNAASAGTEWDAFNANWSAVNGANMSASGLRCKYPATAQKFGNGNICLYIPNSVMSIGAVDAAVRNEWNTSPGLPWLFQGPIYANSMSSDAEQAFNINASATVNGSITTAQINTSTSGMNPATCSGGSTQYTYQFVFVDGNGGQAPAPSQLSVASCTNPLTVGNPATVPPVAVATDPRFIQAVRVDAYRVGGPMPTGKVGSLTCNFNLQIYGCASFVDTGLTATGSVPTVNTTGGGTFAGPVSAPSMATGNASFTNCNGVTSGCTAYGEGSAPTGSANVDTLHADSTDHRFDEIANNGVKQHLTQSLSASGTLTYTAISAQTCQEQTMAVTNATTTQAAFGSPQATLGNTNLSWSAWVSSSGTVSVRVCNPSAGSITPSAVTWTVGAYTP